MDSSNLLEYLKKKYPQRKDLKILNLKNITSGWETEIRSFDLEWEESNEVILNPLVIRIFPGNRVEEKAKKEFTFMKELHNLNYPVPTVYLFETDYSIIGHPFIIMERISGGTIEDRIDMENESLPYWLDVMCRLFVDLHNTNWESLVSEEDRERYRERDNDYFIINDILSDYRAALKHTNSQIFLPIVEWLEERKELVPCEKPSIVHRDFHAMNVLLDEKDNPIVIDWGAAGVSDSRVDTAWSLLLYFAYGTIERRNDLLARYEKALGRKVEHIEYFEVIACLRRLHDVYISLKQGSHEYGLRPEAVEMMKSTIYHVINVRNRLYDLTGIVLPDIDKMLDEIKS